MLGIYQINIKCSYSAARDIDHDINCDILPIASIWLENMPGYLFADITCSEKRTVFRERSQRKTARLEKQIMSKDKHPSIFSPPNGGYRVYYPSNLFRNTHNFGNWRIFSKKPLRRLVSRLIMSATERLSEK